MPVRNYVELHAQIKTTLKRNDVDIDELIGDFIWMATTQFSERLFVLQMEAKSVLTFADGVCAFPTDYRGFRYAVDALGRPISLTTPQQGYALYGHGSGQPNLVSVEGSGIELWPKDSAEITFAYYRDIPHIDAADQTNWLLLIAPNLYVKAALVHAWEHFRDPQKAAMATRWVSAEIQKLNAADKRRRSIGLARVQTGPTP